MDESWKYIPGYEGLYMVSSFGRVMSIRAASHGRDPIMKSSIKHRYPKVHLSKNGVYKWFSIHRLVASAFVPNPNRLPQVNHKNEITTDNRAENLEWCTAKYNSNYGTKINRFRSKVINDPKRSKAIIQLTLDGKFVAEFANSREVERKTGMRRSSIRFCLRGICKTAYKYKWEYK